MALTEAEMQAIMTKVSMTAAEKILNYMNDTEGYCEKVESLPCVQPPGGNPK